MNEATLLLLYEPLCTEVCMIVILAALIANTIDYTTFLLFVHQPHKLLPG